MNDEENLKRRIADSFDPDALVDILGITSEEIVERYWDRIREKLADDFFYVTDEMNTPVEDEIEFNEDEDWYEYDE